MWKFEDNRLFLLVKEEKIPFRVLEADREQIGLFNYDYELKSSIHNMLSEARKSFTVGLADYTEACKNLEQLLKENEKSIQQLCFVCIEHLVFLVEDNKVQTLIRTWLQTRPPQEVVSLAAEYLSIWYKRVSSNGKTTV